MLDLTFGEQVKIILSRKGMTIKELAETIEKRTGKKMSRQNLTQRLGRDNFQEQDMRMIADILGCPFRLSILADSQELEKVSVVPDIEPTEKELKKIEKAKEKKEKKEKKEALAPKVTEAERDMTIGELMDIHKELDELMIEPKANEPEAEEPEAVVLEAGESEAVVPEAGEFKAEEPESAEAEVQEQEDEKPEEPEFAENGQKDEQNEREQSRKKAKGWRAYLQRITHKDEEDKDTEEGDTEDEEQEPPFLDENDEAYEEQQDEGVEDDYIDYEATAYQEIDTEYEEEGEAFDDEIYEDEDPEAGEVNPLTGHEYETNSVRMHPKRIGYVQVYDRSDHRWTDMTEWAFLGYQERKKALLGKDYEPPIYLD